MRYFFTMSYIKRAISIAAYMLAASIAVNGCNYSNSKTPDLQIKFQQTYENDVIDFVVPMAMDKIACSLNSSEILVMDSDGSEIMRESFSSEIIAVDTPLSSKEKITVALSNNEVITYVIEDEITVKYDQSFDHQIKSIASLGRFSDQDMDLVLLETGELYGYGLNYKHILSEDSDEGTEIDTPVLIAENVVYISQFFFITADGDCFDVRSDMISDSLPSGYTDLKCYNGRPLLCTEGTAYLLCYDAEDWREEVSMDAGLVTSYEESLLYRQDGCWYYTGPLSARPVGKGSPWSDNKQVSLPDSYDYQVTYAGVIGYDEHTIIIYSV